MAATSATIVKNRFAAMGGSYLRVGPGPRLSPDSLAGTLRWHRALRTCAAEAEGDPHQLAPLSP